MHWPCTEEDGNPVGDLVKKTVEEKIVNGQKTPKKNISGKGKLTNKLIDKLTVYYGLAIRRSRIQLIKWGCDMVNLLPLQFYRQKPAASKLP